MQASPTPLQAVHTTSASEPLPASAPAPAPAPSLSPVGTPSTLGQTRGSSIRTPLKPTFVFTPVASVSASASSSAPFPSPRAPAPPPVPRSRSPATPAHVFGPALPVHVPSSPSHLSSSPTPNPVPAPTPVPAPVLPHAHAPRAPEPTLAPSPATPARSPAPARAPVPPPAPLSPVPVSVAPRSAPKAAPAPSPATVPAPTLAELPPSEPVVLTPQSAPAPAPALELARALIQAQVTSPAPLPPSDPISVAPQPTPASLPTPNPRRRGRQPKPRLGLGLGLGLIASESPAALSAPSSTASVSRSSSPSALPSASSSTTPSSPGLIPTPGASPAAVPTLRIRLRAPPLPQTPEVNMAKGKGKGTARARGGTGTPARTPGTPGTPTGLPRDASGNATASGAPSSSRRVLPQRIRRAAGGGAEGVRELEEMIVDWLERFGDIDSTPPERLPLVLTTLPVTLATPAARIVDAPAQTSVAPEAGLQAGPSRPRIETPAWKLVSAGEDDRDEAREELTAGARASPTKRLRRGPVSHSAEDTSDAYYEQQHRKFEAFERRQWVREREKLQHARYKMRARVDLLRNLPAGQWVAVVSAILSRKDDGAWARGRRKLDTEGLDWLRRRLIREGRDLLTRYDQLLPNPTETKQTKRRTLDTLDSRLSSPSIASSMSPPPQEVPQKRRAAAPPPSRLQAVKPKRAYSRRKVEETPIVPMDIDSDSSLSSLESSPEPAQPVERELPPVEPPTVRQPSPPRTRARRTTSPVKAATPRLRTPVVHTEVAASVPAPGTPPMRRATPTTTPTISTRSLRLRSSVSPKKSAPPSPVVPVLLSAAEKREAALAEAHAARAKAEETATRTTNTRRARIPREKTRGSERILAAAPFGIPLPPSVESKSEFTLSDEEEFWPLCAARVAHKNEQCRAQHTEAGGSYGVEASGTVIPDGCEREEGQEQPPVQSEDGKARSAGVRDTAPGPASQLAEDDEMKGSAAFPAHQQTKDGVKGSVGMADTPFAAALPVSLAPLPGTLPALPLDDSTDEVDMEGVEAVVL